LTARALVAAALLLLLSAGAQAHVASNSFVELTMHGRLLAGSVELAVRDVELAVGVDSNRDRRVTWRELRAAAPALRSYLADHLTVEATGAPCPVQFGELRVNTRVDGNYAWIPVSVQCPTEPAQIIIRYQVLSGIDPSHRGLLKLDSGRGIQTAVLRSDTPAELALARASRWHEIREYFITGVEHIWSGIDHLLFLLSLLLPAVLIRRDNRWEAVASGRPAFVSILKVVTAFTIAHSITLSLAAFDLVRLPSRLTESVIAASIVVAALNNIFPVVTEGRARIAFAFGLLHGFGFASVLADMGLPAGARATALIAFNCGIEAGQLAVVAAVMPVAFALRRAAPYRQVVLPLGSAVVAVLAFVWFVQRATFTG
jgi:HupE / UreJ protein